MITVKIKNEQVGIRGVRERLSYAYVLIYPEEDLRVGTLKEGEIPSITALLGIGLFMIWLRS